MLLECHNCGAPLDVEQGAAKARCHYCGTRATVARLKTMSMETPKGWAPPSEWKPPPESSMAEETLLYRPARAAASVARWIGFSTLFTLGLGGFIAWRVTSAVENATGASSLSMLTQPGQLEKVVGQAVSAVNQAAGAATKAAREAEENAGLGDVVPVVCAGNRHATITGKTLSLASGSPVIASGNCKLRLVACTVSGATGIVVRNNAEVVVEGGSVAGTGPAAVISDNGSIEVTSNARLSGEATLTVSGNGTVTVRDSAVSGRHVAIVASNNATVVTEQTTVEGQVVDKGRKRR
jgi:LSD1 subclass zinc finger protein